MSIRDREEDNVMKNHFIMLLMAALMISMVSLPAAAQSERYRDDVNYAQYIRYDRYLDVEIWTDDDEYYDGDNINIKFRANKDCYVVVYNIDTRGNVNLLYPSDQYDDTKIERERTYRIPDSYDEYDLTVRGPEGIEYIQIVASRAPIPIPDWDNGFNMVVTGDPLDFLDYINAVYFDCDNGCSLAFDMTLFTVNEWEENYYRPTYNYDYYDYYGWNTYGTVYIDYPWGGTVYIDGIYWGIAPLFIPRIYYGWHYFTIYDSYGYAWEDRINVYRRKSVVLDNTIIKTRAGVKSKYRDVRRKAYLDPAKNGYPDYAEKKRARKDAWETRRTGKSGSSVYKNRVTRQDREATSTRMNKSSSKRSSGTSAYEGRKSQKSQKSKNGKSSTYQSDRKRSSGKAKSSNKSSGKSYDSGKSRKDKSSSRSGSGRSGGIKKSSSGKSSGSSIGARSSSRSSGSRSGGRSYSRGNSGGGRSSRGR